VFRACPAERIIFPRSVGLSVEIADNAGVNDLSLTVKLI
jgi:hypothetical protein